MCCPMDVNWKNKNASTSTTSSSTTSTTNLFLGRRRRTKVIHSFKRRTQLTAAAATAYAESRDESRTSSSPSPIPILAHGRKHVRFAENLIRVSSAPSPLDLIDGSDAGDVWYSLGDLEVFRTEARDLCRQIRSLDDSAQAIVAPDAPRVPSLARDPLTRGLEQRTCLERQRRKYLASRFILKAASKLQKHDAEKLAAVANRCTAWATELAIEEAARDFYRAWDSSLVVACSASQSQPSKRSPEMETDDRRVRARPSLIPV